MLQETPASYWFSFSLDVRCRLGKLRQSEGKIGFAQRSSDPRVSATFELSRPVGCSSHRTVIGRWESRGGRNSLLWKYVDLLLLVALLMPPHKESCKTSETRLFRPVALLLFDAARFNLIVLESHNRTRRRRDDD